MEELLEGLQGTGLFSGIPEEILENCVLPHRQIQEYHKGLFLIGPQQRVNRLGIVLSGKIHLMHIFTEGGYSLMSSLSPGEILGADLIFTRSQLAPYHAMAAADTRVVYFPAELVTQPGMLPEKWRTELLQRLTAWISTLNMKKEYRLAILSQNGLRERITTYLTMQASRRQKTAFTISYSREELAAFLCVNRSALSHELSRMQNEGLITFRKNYFCLHFLNPTDNGKILPF
ncbi:MAG: Crp/Fnr family transcriptional regulator [Eubacteriales bacterium]|nr:Crp/Fnr family transcriptional regulator [Eubacteriales bacterium]